MNDQTIIQIARMMEQLEWESLERVTDKALWNKKFYELIDQNDGYSPTQRWDDAAYRQWLALDNRTLLAPCRWEQTMDLEITILTRLQEVLAPGHRFELVITDGNPALVSQDVPDLRILLLEDSDSLHRFLVSFYGGMRLTVESFALDEFDRLLAFLSRLAP